MINTPPPLTALSVSGSATGPAAQVERGPQGQGRAQVVPRARSLIWVITAVFASA